MVPQSEPLADESRRVNDLFSAWKARTISPDDFSLLIRNLKPEELLALDVLMSQHVKAALHLD